MCEKPNGPITAPKTYWKIINRFLSNKKIPAIPPLLVNGEIISDFSRKASIFNKFFASQRTPLQNSSILPKYYSFYSTKNSSIFTFFRAFVFSIFSFLIKNTNHMT